jgi:hypothetical protein
VIRFRRRPNGRYRFALTLSFDRRQGRIALAFAVSVLFHVAIFSLGPHRPPAPLDFKVPGPMDVTLVEPEPTPQRNEVATATPAPAPPVPRVVPPPRVARARPTPAPRVTPPAPPVPVPTPAPVPATPAPPMDMLAMLNARRQRRQAEQGGAPSAPAPTQGEPTPEQRALAALNRNLKSLSGGQEGVGGVFEILRMGPRTGEFAFNGWFPERHREWREVIEVDAGEKGDIERAMVDRMIQLIRQHYQGDFNWKSQRQGKVVVLSARPEDHAQLEEYLLREFFGTPLVKRQ